MDGVLTAPANFTFSGNSLDGGAGNNRLDLRDVTGAAAKVDLAAGLLFIADSPGNTILNFNTIIGTRVGSDSFIDGKGNQTYSGNGGADSFLFTKRHGADVITDFNTDDTITLTGFGRALKNFAKLLDRATDTADGMLIDTGDGGSITLARTTKAALQADDFIFA